MYHEFDEVRRIHQPYTDNFQRSKYLPVWLACDRLLTIWFFVYSGLLEDPTLQQCLPELEAWHVRRDQWNLPSRAYSSLR